MHFKIVLFDSCFVLFFFIIFANFNHILVFLLAFFYFFTTSFVKCPLFFPTSCFFVIIATFSFSCNIPVPLNKGWLYVCHLCQKLNMNVIRGGWNIIKQEKNKLRPCNIWEINLWLRLNIGNIISCIPCELYNHYPCSSPYDSSSTMYISLHALEKSQNKDAREMSTRML